MMGFLGSDPLNTSIHSDGSDDTNGGWFKKRSPFRCPGHSHAGSPSGGAFFCCAKLKIGDNMRYVTIN